MVLNVGTVKAQSVMSLWFVLYMYASYPGPVCATQLLGCFPFSVHINVFSGRQTSAWHPEGCVAPCVSGTSLSEPASTFRHGLFGGLNLLNRPGAPLLLDDLSEPRPPKVQWHRLHSVTGSYGSCVKKKGMKSAQLTSKCAAFHH